jgi:hypothetical protein
MNQLGPALLSLALATSLAALELITSQYPRTFSLLRRSWAFYAYATIYGIIAFCVMLGLRALLKSGTVKLEGLGLSSPWVQAVAIGVAFKAFLHIRLFSVSIGAESFPVGVETLVQLFEPWLLRTIELDHFNALRNYIAPRAQKYTDLDLVKKQIAQNLPPSMSADGAEGKAFLADVQRAVSVSEVLRLYMSSVGRGLFDSVFPL